MEETIALEKKTLSTNLIKLRMNIMWKPLKDWNQKYGRQFMPKDL